MVGDDESPSDDDLFDRYGNEVIDERVVPDELYDRFGHDARYLHDEIPYRNPHFGERGLASGWSNGIADDARTSALLRSMLLWFGAIVLLAVALGFVAVLFG